MTAKALSNPGTVTMTVRTFDELIPDGRADEQREAERNFRDWWDGLSADERDAIRDAQEWEV